ncbi:hypothetical protein BOX15_Mlig013550g1 [Macrostomum lignano]|uniref:Alpha-1,3-mannosyl-glycoprotein 2-beta-N-acetylglucosaminyltransferase n=1 Tax=Macrostomum lignano TaxID=282301 RepID=A0A267FTG0_9PLAT|nr:hypothetical protein BOX15_Mlig013550g1 [Macrostomum lignano]
MINRRHWLQVRKVWPKTQYDDFLRLYMLNNRLVCVRPELSRTFNIGRNGGRVLSGKNGYSSTFYHNYLSRMALNSFNVTLLDSSIDKVIGRSADIKLEKFARSLPVTNVSTLLSQPKPPSAVRLRYASAEEFIGIAERIGAIPEVWFGAPRASILGISVMSLRRTRVYIVPDKRLPITKKILTPEHVQKKQKKDPKKKNDSKKKVVTKKKQDPKQKKDYKKKKNLKKQKDQKKKEDPKQKEDPKKKKNLKKQKDQKKKEDPKQKVDPKKKEDR